MLGSKNSELTRKYDSTMFALITLGFSRSLRRAYSTKPTRTKTSASETRMPRHPSSSRELQRILRRRMKSSENGT